MDGPAEWLTGPEGTAAIAAAARQPDSLTGVTALRAQFPQLTAEQASAAMTQASLRRLAAERYGVTAPRWLTRDGLEQATRPEVAALRAERIAAAHPRRIIDATAGLGFDTAALAATGIPVIAIERDPQTAAFCQANVPEVRVLVGDAADVLTALGPGPEDAVFIDPARRNHRRSADGSRAHPERDPERWSPPWSFAQELARRTRVCAKVAPGFSPAAVPVGWCAQWTSVQRTPVEACLWSWPALPDARRATAIVDGQAHMLDGNASAPASVDAVGRWLHEPDPAVIASGLVDDLAHALGIGRVDAHPYWLTGDEPVTSPLLRSFRVVERLPHQTKELRRALLAHGFGAVTAKTKGGSIDADALRRSLRLPGGPMALIALSQFAGAPACYLLDTA